MTIDRIGPGQILVIAAGGHAETATIGEILSGHMRRRGAIGLICDGAIRDVGTLAQWTNFPVFLRCEASWEESLSGGRWLAETFGLAAPADSLATAQAEPHVSRRV